MQKILLIVLCFLLFNCKDENPRLYRIPQSEAYTAEFKHVYTIFYDSSEIHGIYVRTKNAFTPDYDRLLELCYCYLDTLSIGRYHKYPVGGIEFYNTTYGFPQDKLTWDDFDLKKKPFFTVYLDMENQASPLRSLIFNGEKSEIRLNLQEILDNYRNGKCGRNYRYSGMPFFREIKEALPDARYKNKRKK